MPRLVPASLTFATALAFAHDAHAKAAYASLPAVLDDVETVAIVDTASITAVEIEGEHWVYHELVDAQVVDVVAGELPRRIEIVGGRNFICAPVNWYVGTRYLALLVHDRDHWTATNNDWGQIEIVGDMVDWPYDDSDDMVPLDEIVTMLEARLEARLGRGRYTDEREPVVELEYEIVRATPPVVQEAAAPVEERSPAPWIALGAVAVALGFIVGTRRNFR